MTDAAGSTAYTDPNTLLEAHARLRPAKVFIDSPDQSSRITFGEFEALTRRFVNFLTATGVQPGDRISVLAENSIEALVILWGTLRAGVIVNPINVEIREKDIGQILHDVAPRLVFWSRELGELRIWKWPAPPGSRSARSPRRTRRLTTCSPPCGRPRRRR